MIKNVEDLAGDRQEGLNTLPIFIERRPALLIAMIASPVPYFIGMFGIAYLVLVAPAAFDPTGGQSLLKYGMYFSSVAFIGSCLTLLL